MWDAELPTDMEKLDTAINKAKILVALLQEAKESINSLEDND